MIPFPRLGLAGLLTLAPLSMPALAGPVMRVEAVELRGVERTSADALRRALAVAEGEDMPLAALKAVRERALALGVYRAVDLALADAGKRLVVTVVENPLLTEVRFQGVSRIAPEKLAGLFGPQRGRVANEQALAEAEAKLASVYQAAGFPLARVTQRTLHPDGALELRVEEGRFDRVRIEGLEKTEPALVRRELAYQPGEVFDAARFERDVERLKGLKLVERLTPRADGTALVLDAKDGQPRDVMLGVGYSTRIGFSGAIGVSDRNFLGLGHQVGVTVGGDQQGRFMGDTAYVAPWLDAQRTSLGTNLYRRQFNNWMGDFRDERQGLRLFASRPVGGPPLETPWSAFAGLQLEQVRAFDNLHIGGAPKGQYLDGSAVTVSPTGVDLPVSLGLALTRDTRASGLPADRRHTPTQGALHAILLEPGLVNGGTPFLKGTAMATHYVPLPSFPYGHEEPAALVFSGRLGMLAAPVVPAYKRFYSADVYFDAPMTLAATSLSGNPYLTAMDFGRTSPFLIRGWTQTLNPGLNALSPSMPSVYFQGANALVGTLEYRFPIWNIVSGALFLDGGGFWEGLPSLAAFHVGYGGGIRVFTPMGPIWLDYAMSGVAPPRFHFGIGYPF